MNRASRSRTPAGDLAQALERTAAQARAGAYPLSQFAHDRDGPVRYVLERLREPHIMPWQVAMLQAFGDAMIGTPDPARPTGKCPAGIAVRAGQKCGKTKVGVWIALCFYECAARARFFMCAAIVEQAKNVLWRELADTLREAAARGVIIDGKLAASPAGGFVSTDGSREIRGVSGREIEALAGLSGNLVVWIDEASHLPEGKAQAFAGNTLGGGIRILTSNPTKNVGPFYEAFHRQSDFWATFHVDGEDVADWQEKTGVRIPFTVSRERIEEFRLLYGEESPFWHLRVKGNWLRNEAGKICSMALIVEAQARYASAVDDGVTSIGYDPAGVDADRGDWHVWTVVRGTRLVASHKKRGLDVEAAVAETLAIINVYRRDDETPMLQIDTDGVGGPIAARLLDEAQRRQRHEPARAFRAWGVKPSSPKTRDQRMHARVRDELWYALAAWLKTGAIPPSDAMLEAELYAPSWEVTPLGQAKATDKSELRNILGRSVDHADSLALAVRNPEPANVALQPPAPASPRDIYEQNAQNTQHIFNPYRGMQPWIPHGGGRR